MALVRHSSARPRVAASTLPSENGSAAGLGPEFERDALVDGERLVDRKLADQQGRRSRRRILRGLQSGERRRRTGGARDSNDGGERQPSRQDHFLRALAPEARCVQGNRLCHGGR